MGIKARVKRGIKLLDEVRPGWEQEIKVEELDLSDGCNCVLGQLYGRYTNGAYELFPEGHTCDHKAIRRGFYVDNDHEYLEAEYEDLTEEWERKILKRQGAST